MLCVFLFTHLTEAGVCVYVCPVYTGEQWFQFSLTMPPVYAESKQMACLLNFCFCFILLKWKCTPLIILFLKIYLFYVNERFPRMYGCGPHASENGIGSLRTEVMDRNKSPFGCWELKPGLLNSNKCS